MSESGKKGSKTGQTFTAGRWEQNPELGQRLKRAIAAAKMTHSEFAAEAGRTVPGVGAWVRNGVHPSSVFHVADILDVNPRWLVDVHCTMSEVAETPNSLSMGEILEILKAYAALPKKQRAKYLRFMQELGT